MNARVAAVVTLLFFLQDHAKHHPGGRVSVERADRVSRVLLSFAKLVLPIRVAGLLVFAPRLRWDLQPRHAHRSILRREDIPREAVFIFDDDRFGKRNVSRWDGLRLRRWV